MISGPVKLCPAERMWMRQRPLIHCHFIFVSVPDNRILPAPQYPDHRGPPKRTGDLPMRIHAHRTRQDAVSCNAAMASMVPQRICRGASRHGTGRRSTSGFILSPAEKIIYRVFVGGIYGNSTFCTDWVRDGRVLSVFAGIPDNTGTPAAVAFVCGSCGAVELGTTCRRIPSARVGRITSAVNSTQWRQVNTAISFFVSGIPAVGWMCKVTNAVLPL